MELKDKIINILQNSIYYFEGDNMVKKPINDIADEILNLLPVDSEIPMKEVKSDYEIKELAHKKVDWFNDQESGVFWGTEKAIFEVGYFHGYKDASQFTTQRQVITDSEIEKYFTSQHFDNKNGHHYRVNKDRIFGAKAMRDGKIGKQ